MIEMLHTVEGVDPSIGLAAHPDPNTHSVAFWVASALEFADQPLSERMVIRSPDGGYTFEVKPIASSGA